jgi:hypothetical protein
LTERNGSKTSRNVLACIKKQKAAIVPSCLASFCVLVLSCYHEGSSLFLPMTQLTMLLRRPPTPLACRNQYLFVHSVTILLLLSFFMSTASGSLKTVHNISRPFSSSRIPELSTSAADQCVTTLLPWSLSSYAHILPNFHTLSIHNSSLWPIFLKHLHRLDSKDLWRHTPAYSLPTNTTDILDYVLHRQFRSVVKSESREKGRQEQKRTINIAVIGGSFARGHYCEDPVTPSLSGSRKFSPISVNESCSYIALMAHYLNQVIPPPLSVTAYNLGITGCGHTCLVEIVQGYYLVPNAETLHVVFIDVCANDLTVDPLELEVTYLEVIGFVRRKGGEVVFLCGWSKSVLQGVVSPRVNYDVAFRWNQTSEPIIRSEDTLTYNRCGALGIHLSSRFLFPAISYQDPLLSQDGSFSEDSESTFRSALPCLIAKSNNHHPSMFGNDYIAQMLSRWIWWRICHVLSLPSSITPPPIPLFHSASSSLAKLIDTEEDFLPIITLHDGFEWIVENLNKPGWVSERPGSMLVIDLPAPVASGFLSIGYLQTYSSVGFFKVTMMHGSQVLMTRHVACIIKNHFSQTAFVTFPFDVSHPPMSLHIEIEHLKYSDAKKLKNSEDLKRFFQVFRKTNLKEISIVSGTKVKIISIGIYDSLEGTASRPRDVDYNARNNLVEVW